MQHCFSLERKSRVSLTVADKPWAYGLSRLLNERRGLTKGKLARLAPLDDEGRDFRAAMVSKIAAGVSDAFLLSYLQRLADAFTKYDRDKTAGNPKADPNAPAVELWEFFVSDEQAALLRERDMKTRAESDDQVFLKRAAELFAQSLRQARTEQHQPLPSPVLVEQPKKRKER